MSKSILIVGEESHCRSYMFAAFLKHYDNELSVVSSGISPAAQIDSRAIKAMQLVGATEFQASPCSVSKYLSSDWDFVVTVSRNVTDEALHFTGKIGQIFHFNFDKISSSESNIPYFKLRDEIRIIASAFFRQHLQGEIRCACGANEYCKCH